MLKRWIRRPLLTMIKQTRLFKLRFDNLTPTVMKNLKDGELLEKERKREREKERKREREREIHDFINVISLRLMLYKCHSKLWLMASEVDAMKERNHKHGGYAGRIAGTHPPMVNVTRS